MWKIDSFGVYKVRGKYWYIEDLNEYARERVLSGDLLLRPSLDGANVIAYEAVPKGPVMACFVFDVLSLNKVGGYEVDIVNPDLNDPTQYYEYFDQRRSQRPYQHLGFTDNYQRITSFINGKYLMVATTPSPLVRCPAGYNIIDSKSGEVVNQIDRAKTPELAEGCIICIQSKTSDPTKAMAILTAIDPVNEENSLGITVVEIDLMSGNVKKLC